MLQVLQLPGLRQVFPMCPDVRKDVRIQSHAFASLRVCIPCPCARGVQSVAANGRRSCSPAYIPTVAPPHRLSKPPLSPARTRA